MDQREDLDFSLALKACNIAFRTDSASPGLWKRFFSFFIQNEEGIGLPVLLRNIQIGQEEGDEERVKIATELLNFRLRPKKLHTKDFMLLNEMLVSLLNSKYANPKSIKRIEFCMLRNRSLKYFTTDVIIEVMKGYNKSRATQGGIKFRAFIAENILDKIEDLTLR